MKRFGKDNLGDIDLTDEEKEFVGNIKESIYGE